MWCGARRPDATAAGQSDALSGSCTCLLVDKLTRPEVFAQIVLAFEWAFNYNIICY